MANEFTLADYERTAPDNLNKAVARTWRETSPILEMLSFKQSGNLAEKFLRLNSVPTPTWRKIGETFTQVKVNPEPIEERMFFLGAKIDIPCEYVKANSLVDLRGLQEEAAMKGTAQAFNEAFFINTPSDNEDAIVGLWYRLVNDFGSGNNQVVSAGDLDISYDTAVTSWQHKTFDVVDDLLSRVDGNPADKVLFCGRTMYRRLQSAFRSSNLLSTTTDQLGRQFMTYGVGGPMLIDVGYKADQTTTILGDVETAFTSLTGGAKSSLYCVRFGEPYLAGFAQDMPYAEDVGETEDRVNYRTVVKFSPGMYLVSPRSIAIAHSWVAA
jgi:hypothetical protein